MKVIAATEKTKIAIRNAYNYLGGDDLSNQSTGHMLNGKFDNKDNKRYKPFQMQILNYTSGAALKIHPGHISIYDDIQVDEITVDYEQIDLINLGHWGQTIYPSGIWDIVFVIDSQFEYDYEHERDKRKQWLFLVMEGSMPLSSGWQFPKTHGLYSTMIGRIEKRVLSGAFPQSQDPDAYWDILDQYVDTNLSIWFNDVRKQFCLKCSCNIPTSGIAYEIVPLGFQGITLSLNHFDFIVNPGMILLENQQIPVSGFKTNATSLQPGPSGAFFYVNIDLNNTGSSFIDIYDNPQNLFQDGSYNWFLGQAFTSISPFATNCISEYNGPIYMPFVIKSNGLLFGNNNQISGIPLSTGFLEVVSSAIQPSGITYNIQFTEATECDE